MPGAYDQQSLALRFEQVNKRLGEIEAQLKVLSDAAGVAYEHPLSEIPPDVVELAQAGETMKAAQRYRELTNASAEEAIEVVQGL